MAKAYNMYAMTAAHKTLPIPSYARVRSPANGRGWSCASTTAGLSWPAA